MAPTRLLPRRGKRRQSAPRESDVADETWRPQALAPYATLPWASRGRLHKEAETRTRSPFQRDRDRIIHSTAFRRLKHKTQVFVFDEGDHYRTRLTHTLEVMQVSRGLPR